MNASRWLYMPLILAQGMIGCAAEPAVPRPGVVAELRAYYTTGDRQPAWKEAVERLASRSQATQAEAADYLRDLLAQAHRDERSGAAPWRATPFWGNSGENPARNLRQWIVESLGEGKPTTAALPVLRWVLAEESVSAFQETAMKALARLEGRDADALRAKLAGQPHPNSAVVVAALDQLGQSKGPLPADVLASLCRHYRPSIRKAARKLHVQRGGKELPPFDAAGAMRSAPIRKLMTAIAATIVEPPPAQALPPPAPRRRGCA